MIECKVESDKRIFLNVSGSLETIVIDTNAIVGEIYQGLKARNPDAAMAYRTAVVAALSDPNNYAWREEDEKGGENQC